MDGGLLDRVSVFEFTTVVSRGGVHGGNNSANKSILQDTGGQAVGTNTYLESLLYFGTETDRVLKGCPSEVLGYQNI